MLALLGARKFEAEVVCPGGGVLSRELRLLGVKQHPLEFSKYSVRQNPLWHVGFYRRFRQILKLSKPQVVVINLDGNTPLVTLATARAGIPIIRFSRFEFKPPTRWLDRWCWLKAMAIVCPSDLVKQQVLAWAPPEVHSRVHRFYDAYAGRAATPVAWGDSCRPRRDSVVDSRTDGRARALLVGAEPAREQRTRRRTTFVSGDHERLTVGRLGKPRALPSCPTR